MIAATVNGRPVITRVPVALLAEAWRQHAQVDGMTDTAVQLSAEPVQRDCGCTAWFARFYVPRTGTAIVIECAEPHRTAQAARAWLAGLLQCLHDNGNITLWPREGEDA